MPADLAYVGTYPHNAEYLFAVFRALQPDDTWLDAAQIPFGIVGACVTTLLARRWGAPRPVACSAGAAWLAAPAVFLQLPSGYVDVCAATFLLLSVFSILEAPAPAAICLSGVSLGLLLGSKPSAPLPAAILVGWLIVRAAPRVRWLVPALAATFVLGLPDYVANWNRFANPCWPVALTLGPLHLPGTTTRGELLAAGARAARLSGPLWLRIVRSWSTLRGPPAFDMRIGEFGAPTVLLALPAPSGRCAVGPPPPSRSSPARPLPIPRRRGSSSPFRRSASPSPRRARPSCGRRRSPARWSWWLSSARSISAHATPALTGEGPSLERFLAMSEEQRLRALGPDGPPGRSIDLRRSLAAGEAIAFDRSFYSSYLLWRRHLENRVVSLPDALSPADVGGLLGGARVRFLIAGQHTTAGALARARGYRRLFACGTDPCAVYEVTPTTGLASVQ